MTERGPQLHGRSCRGESLSAEEQAELESWYAEMDAAEARSLRVSEDSPSAEGLRARLKQEMDDLRRTVEEIQEIHGANDALRQEIDAFKRRLAERHELSGR